MNPAGAVLVIIGTWVVSQVFAGNALQRLNIIKPTETGPGFQLPDIPNPIPAIPKLQPYLPGGPGNPVLPML